MQKMQDIQNVLTDPDKSPKPKAPNQLITDHLAGQLWSFTDPRTHVLVHNDMEQVVFRMRMGTFDGSTSDNWESHKHHKRHWDM